MLSLKNIHIAKNVLEEITINLNKLEKDPSNYAPGRMRGWLFKEWDLKNKVFKEPQIKSELLELFCKTAWPECEIALVTYSGEDAIGIKLHRDDSYAAFKAATLNVTGNCEFEYLKEYPGLEWSKERLPQEQREIVHLSPGDLVEFNCKNRHAAKPSKNRIGISMWKISNKHRKVFVVQGGNNQ